MLTSREIIVYNYVCTPVERYDPCPVQVQKHESVLELDSGKALRIVNVLSVHVLNSRGQVGVAL